MLLLGGAFILSAIVLNGPITGPAAIAAAFAVTGFARSVLWVLMYRKNAFLLNGAGVWLQSASGEREFPLEEISGMRFLVPASGPEFRQGGFQKIEVELTGNGKIKHKLAIFKNECQEKSDELDEIAPQLGFERSNKTFADVGFWRK
ncbi:hypothetical protein [Streptomonospora litoralis]|uniref:hypothetical protein n=1 Tax=Streptomonospora litoralis TaxID=2498135 RepID=UPI0010363E8B|nr:hypothetical protein [Streptomonospora litoralis]